MSSGGMSNFENVMTNPMFQAGLTTLASNTQSRQPGGGGRAVQHGLSAFNQAQQFQMMQQRAQQQAEAQEQAKAREAALSSSISGFMGAKTPEEKNQALVGMLQSDPALAQKIIPSMLADPKQSAFAEKLQLAGIDPQTPEGQKDIRDILMKPSIQMTMGKPLTAGEYKEETQSIIADKMADDIKALVDGGAEVGTKAAVRKDLASNKWTSGTVNLEPNEAKLISLEENYSNMLVAAMRGAQVGPMEQIKFEKSLPRIGQDKQLFMSNLETTKKNIQTLIERSGERRKPGGGSAPSPLTPPAAPQGSTAEQADAILKEMGLLE